MTQETLELCLYLLEDSRDELKKSLIHLEHQLTVPENLRIIEVETHELEKTIDKLKRQIFPLEKAINELKESHELEADTAGN